MNPLVSANRTVAFLIASNKPFYPLYIWYFVGSGVWASCLTALSLPIWLALGIFGPRAPLWLRIGVPVLGALDTLIAAKLFGESGLAELFFAPCALLAILSFRPDEAKFSRALLAGLYVAFVALHGRYGAPWHAWTDAELHSIANINAFAVASLTAFLGWRFVGAPR